MQCGKWIHSRCAGEKGTQINIKILLSENIMGIFERQWSRKELCTENSKCTKLGGWVSKGGGCEAAMSARKTMGRSCLEKVVSYCVKIGFL